MYKNSAASRKKLFYDSYFESVLNYNKENSNFIYDTVVLNNKVQRDLDNKYLYARVRYYGYSNKFTDLSNNSWKWYDLLFATVAFAVLILMFIYR